MRAPYTDQLPLSLKVVAWLFILTGASSVIGVFVGLLNWEIDLDVYVLALPAGIGLLKLSRGWRVVALTFAWMGLILGLVAVVATSMATGFGGAEGVEIFGQNFALSSKAVAVAGAFAIFCFFLWQVGVLMSPAVRDLFELGIVIRREKGVGEE